jgi:hypothetical protein
MKFSISTVGSANIGLFVAMHHSVPLLCDLVEVLFGGLPGCPVEI